MARQTCPLTEGRPQQYAFNYTLTVSGGRVTGERGQRGKPSFMSVAGQIGADGKASLLIEGLSGDPQNSGGVPPGTRYSYPVEANFSGSGGTGMRTIGPTCSVVFERTPDATAQTVDACGQAMINIVPAPSCRQGFFRLLERTLGHRPMRGSRRGIGFALPCCNCHDRVWLVR